MRLFNRQKVLLKTILKLNEIGIKSRTANVKSQFILEREYFLGDKIKFYNFFPYKYGPFSNLCFYDMRILQQEGLLNEDETELTEKGLQKLKDFSMPFNAQIEDVITRFGSDKKMTKYVYDNYPDYTVKSELVNQNPKKQETGIFTIGYEGRDIDKLLNILIKNNIDILIDVRKNPFSMNFSYIKKSLIKYLKSVDIEYMHIPELGINSKDRKELNTKEDYDLLFADYRKGLVSKEIYINRLMELGKEKKIVLLCYEEDVNYCHRGQIANAIRKKGLKVLDL